MHSYYFLYIDLKYKCTCSCPDSVTLSTMNNCVGFPIGSIANSYATYSTGRTTAITTTITSAKLISIILNTTDRLYLLTIQETIEQYRYQLIRHVVLLI